MNIGEALAERTFDLELDDDELVTDVLILARVTRMGDGRSVFAMAGSDGIDNVTKTGLIACATQVNAGGWSEVDDG